MAKYVRIRSWHVVKTLAGGRWLALCGRSVVAASATVVDELPVNEKSCERCLQLDAKRK